ncbi:MAG: cation acetate symporter [Dermatophilaceae bacterium]|nr:cation acetate symporter [Dermatophilaceae bacterium]
MNTSFGITAISAVCLVTLTIGALGFRLSRTTSDFYVASRMVTPAWNASAIGGEYLSAASFLGVAGLIYSLGADMLWLPVGYTVGYLVLLLFVAAPLRRSGAYTIPDFAQARMESPAVRRLCSVMVLAIGWLYLLPQFKGAGLVLHTVSGAPLWVGNLVVAVVVLINVVGGGMRSITLVQAVQYWIKVTAISVPAFVLVSWWLHHGQPVPQVTALRPDQGWALPLSGFGGVEHPVYATYSMLLALAFGTMGLPHVLVRFYTNPDGQSTRRTTLVVLALLGLFYLFPPLYGAFGRIYLPRLPAGISPDSITLLLPTVVIPGVGGELLSAILAGGAFAALLSTASGLTICAAGVVDQDLVRGRLRRVTGNDARAINGFRIAAVAAVAVPFVLSLAARDLGLADTVGLAFAIAASTFCPLLVLGIWWPRLSTTGAVAGLLCGGVLAMSAVLTTVIGGLHGGWAGALLAQPAAWTVPIAFVVTVVVSMATPSRIPRGTARTMVRLHTPENLVLDRAPR